MDTYQPLWDIAHFAQHQKLKQVLERQIEQRTAAIQSELVYEPGALALQSLIESLCNGSDKLPATLPSVKVQDITRTFNGHSSRNYNEKQIAGLLRSLGFDVKPSGGPTKVMGLFRNQLEAAAARMGLGPDVVPPSA